MKHRHCPAFVLLALLAVAPLTGCPSSLRAGDTRTFDGIPFQWCPPGTFAMGSPGNEEGRSQNETLHEVTLTKGFWISTYEVTQAQWEAIMGDNPSSFLGDDNPVDNVSWDDVQDFLVYLNLDASGGSYRLPTDAEWEYACRAGTSTRFYWGKDANETAIDDYAWYAHNAHGETQPVGQKLPNAWGIHDMSGNLFEWCQDYYSSLNSTSPVTDPTGPTSGIGRVVRGGVWLYDPTYCRSAYRSYNPHTVHNDGVGFRLVRVQD